ncbi:MAG: hypothetical protein MUC37_01005 [Hyphomicrobium sp.]|jgi:hypothetical protein|nr:hypothetical protein [Hyphomicrobium sp.]
MRRDMMFLAITLMMIFPAAAQSGGSNLSIDDLGARHGQALAAARICPGARTTGKVAELAASLPAGQQPAFEAASSRILAAWDKAFACKDVDPAQYPREVNSCRKAKILTCSSTWAEIGPEGSALPGLLEFAPAD